MSLFYFETLSKQNAWFLPVCTLSDYMVTDETSRFFSWFVVYASRRKCVVYKANPTWKFLCMLRLLQFIRIRKDLLCRTLIFIDSAGNDKWPARGIAIKKFKKKEINVFSRHAVTFSYNLRGVLTAVTTLLLAATCDRKCTLLKLTNYVLQSINHDEFVLARNCRIVARTISWNLKLRPYINIYELFETPKLAKVQFPGAKCFNTWEKLLVSSSQFWGETQLFCSVSRVNILWRLYKHNNKTT